MNIRLDKIGAEPYRWQETVEIPVADLEGAELLDLSPVSWSGEVRIDRPGFRLEGRLAYAQTVACDRCLSPVVQKVNTDVSLLVIVNAAQPTDEEVELSAEDLEVMYVEGEELDLDEVLHEQLQLNVPMRVICKDDCQGLCPVCGVNRNVERCNCVQSETDPRWDTLRGFGSDG